MEALGTAVSVNAEEMTVDIALNDSVDSLPPEDCKDHIGDSSAVCLHTFEDSSIS